MKHSSAWLITVLHEIAFYFRNFPYKSSELSRLLLPRPFSTSGEFISSIVECFLLITRSQVFQGIKYILAADFLFLLLCFYLLLKSHYCKHLTQSKKRICLTRPCSTSLVNMTMVVAFSCQIILQKSWYVPGTGP